MKSIKKNQLPEEEKKKVEDEIEKAEAINEYLADKLERGTGGKMTKPFRTGKRQENTFHEEKEQQDGGKRSAV